MFQHVVLKQLQNIADGKFGLERENLRVTASGRLAMTPHPKTLGDKCCNPEITTDFSTATAVSFAFALSASNIVEMFSVILQVSYFKITKGKRLFKMSPIHHHFEMSGWSEVKIVVVFSLVTAIVGILTFLAVFFTYSNVN